MNERPWPLAGYAPGNYTCKCIDCDKQFDGDKRAIQCLECAAISVKSRAPSLSPAPGAVVEALREAAERFEEIRLILVHHLNEPERTAFWKAVDGRKRCQAALASLSQPAKGDREGSAFAEMLTALRQVEAEMRAGLGSSYGETREQVRRAIASAERCANE